MGEQRAKKLEARLKKRRSQNLVLSALELADLSDKRAALQAILKLSASAVQELKDIEDLRNAVAHAIAIGTRPHRGAASFKSLYQKRPPQILMRLPILLCGRF
jgi:hypothetical protein